MGNQLGWWLFADSLVGGSFGVFFGGWFSDRIVTKLGLHARLWVLSGFTLIAVPFSCLTLYLNPPAALVMLLLYYFCAETWFAILFTVIVEIVNPEAKAISYNIAGLWDGSGSRFLLAAFIIFKVISH